MKKLLLLSSSRLDNTVYLDHAKAMIQTHLSEVRSVVFIPYAGVTVNYDEYTVMVQTALSDLAVTVKGIHQFDCPKAAINEAEAVLVGGGNTFRLLERLYHFDLIALLKAKVEQGMPYIGWSAGSNIAGLSIKTTNDMPIIEPPSFGGLQLVNCQLNPHYTDYNPPGHNGETREQRIAEFMVLSPETPIIGIVEGSALNVLGQSIELLGDKNGYYFIGGKKKVIDSGDQITL